MTNKYKQAYIFLSRSLGYHFLFLIGQGPFITKFPFSPCQWPSPCPCEWETPQLCKRKKSVKIHEMSGQKRLFKAFWSIAESFPTQHLKKTEQHFLIHRLLGELGTEPISRVLMTKSEVKNFRLKKYGNSNLYRLFTVNLFCFRDPIPYSESGSGEPNWIRYRGPTLIPIQSLASRCTVLYSRNPKQWTQTDFFSDYVNVRN